MNQMRESTNKFWECPKKWAQPISPLPKRGASHRVTVESKNSFIYYYFFLKFDYWSWCYKYSIHGDTTRANNFDYWSNKAKPEVEPRNKNTSIFLQFCPPPPPKSQVSQVTSPYSPNPYFNLKFYFSQKKKKKKRT